VIATLVLPSRRWRAALSALTLFFVACIAFAQDRPWQAKSDDLAAIPALTARVTDRTNTLSASERQALETKLADWEAKTGNQLVVLIVPTTKPEPIESYSIRVAEAWKIGRKGQDNGAIFVVAKDDHRMRIEVGYGLEGVLTDVTSHRILDETVAPLFKQNRFAEGIEAGVDRIISVVGSGQPLPAPAKSQSRASPGHGFDFGELLIFLFVAVPIIGSILSRIFGRVLGSGVGGGVLGAAAWLLAGSVAIGVGVAILVFLFLLLFTAGAGLVAPGGIGSGSRRGGVWFPGGGGFGGGGFGGGGGGGFSGGGGSFGGGGSSGSW